MRSLIGTVVSAKSAQTAIVRIDRVKEHPIYRKKFRMSTHIAVHDPEGKAREGAKVRITETRPVSKTKHFILSEVLEAPEGEAVALRSRGSAHEDGAPSRARTERATGTREASRSERKRSAVPERTASESAEARGEDR